MRRILLAGLAIGVLTACGSMVPYSQYSSDETARLKRESLALFSHAHEDYRLHEDRVESVIAGVQSAYRDAEIRHRNDESRRLWVILLDPEQNSLAGVLRQWKEDGKLSPAAVAVAKKRIVSDFDAISKLERGKRR
jgi:hypothetical protein